MSVKVMSAVWEREDMDASERLVMLSLADHADDEGVCYPSIARLCKRTSLANRTVQMAVKRLEARGLIYVEPNAGRNGTNMFYLFASGPVRQVSKERTGGAATKRRKDAYNPHSVFARDGYRCVYCGFQDERNGSDAGLALHVDHALPLSRGGTDEPSNLVTSCVNCNLRKGDKTVDEFMGRIKCTPQQMHPAFDDAIPPHLTAITPAGDAPKPSGTIKEPSDVSKAREAAALLESWAGAEAVASFLAYRRKSKGKALTLTASKRLAQNLKAIFQAGGNPDDALGMAEERGWLTIEPDWYFNAKGKHHGNRPSAADNPTLRAIARAAGAFEASPVDWPSGRSLA